MPCSRSQGPSLRRGRWPALGSLSLLVVTACTRSPPERIVSDLDPRPTSPRIVRLLGRSPGRCPEIQPDTPAEKSFRAAKTAFETGSYESAAAHFQSAAQGFADAGRSCRRVDALNGLGKAQRWSGEVEPALATYSQALDLAESIVYLAGAAETLNNLGVLETNRQGFRRALEHYAGARALWQRVGNPHQLLLARQNAGITLFSLGRWESAERTLTAASSGFEALGRKAALERGIGLSWLGRAEAARGELRSAERTIERGLEVLREVGKPVWIASALETKAGILIELERRSEAEAALEEARTLLADDPKSLTNVLCNLADLYERDGRLEKALATCHRVREMIVDHHIDDPHLFMHTRFIEARAQRRSGHPEIATALMEPVITTLESLRSGSSGELLSAFFNRRRIYYDLYVDLLLDQGRPSDAFDTAELAKSRGLLDRLVWQPREIRAVASPRLAELDRQTREKLAGLGHRFEAAARASAPDRAEIAELSAHASELRFELARLETEMRTAHGGARAAVKPLRLETIQRLIEPDTMVLAYWLGPERSVLWTIDRSGARADFDLPPREHLEKAATKLRSYLAQGSRTNRQAERELRDLAAHLLGPLTGRALPEHLLIIPDGALTLVPFAALPSRALGEQGQRLIAHHTLSFGYSVSTVAAIRASAEERRRAQRLDLALVFDPVSSPDDPRLPSPPATTAVPTTRWQRLHWAAAEGNFIKARVPPSKRRVLEGFEANRERVLAGGLGGARYVHVAAHGELHPENPELSFLVLSSYDPLGHPIDSLLKLDDVDQLALDADVVVLSGCDTALGKMTRSEGPFGFPQAFLYAGAGSVIASLGSVDDQATSKLMQVFYRELFDNHLTIARAFRGAQLELARSERWRDPAFWASFVLLGDGKT